MIVGWNWQSALLRDRFRGNKHGMSIPTEYPFDFDPTYGMTLADLQAIRPPESP